MYNIIDWMSETHKQRGKVLIYGDRDKNNNSYNVKHAGGSGFNTSIPGVVSMLGFTPEVKNYEDFGGVFIITDHNWFQPTGNQILRKFGSEFYGNVNRNSGHDAYKLSTIWSNLSGTEYDRDHQLWNGFTELDSIPASYSEGNVRLFTPVQDIVAQSGTLVFNAGETEKEVKLKINGDNVKESNEIFKFMLQSGDDTGHINSDSVGKEITILDDD